MKQCLLSPWANLVTLQVISDSPPILPSPKTRGLLNLDQNSPHVPQVHLLNSLVAAGIPYVLRNCLHLHFG